MARSYIGCRRGLWNLWILFSVPWMMVWGYGAIIEGKIYFERIGMEKKLRQVRHKMEKIELPQHLVYTTIPRDKRWSLLSDVILDKTFLKLPTDEQRKVMIELSDDFAKLSHDEQIWFIIGLKREKDSGDFTIDKGDLYLFICAVFAPLLLLAAGVILSLSFSGLSSRQTQ